MTKFDGIIDGVTGNSPGVPGPRVSVLLPVFNAAEFLPLCLKSIGRQTFEDFEIVAIDDGSTDRSVKILKEWGRSDGRLRLLERPHRGLVSSLNEGLAACKEELIARMDADDVIHPERLKLQVELLERNPQVAAVSCLVRHFPSKVVAEGFRLYDEWLNSLLLHEEMATERFIESPIAHPSVMFRKEAVELAGSYRDIGWAEDYDLWLRLFERGVRFAKIPRTLLFWRESGSRLSRNDSRYSPDAFLKCKAHFFARGPASNGKNVIVWGAGPNGKRIHRYLSDEGVTIKALIDIDPSKIGRNIRGIDVFSPDRLLDLMDEQTVVVAAVASRGARILIRERLVTSGLSEGQEFWCLL